jgi:flap endonuclease-1
VGIDLGDIVVRRPATMADYAGKRIAFDAWNILYQFLSSIRAPDGTPLKDREGRVTSHLAGTLYRTASLVEAGIKPIFVFDGAPHPLKMETLAGRAARKVEAEAARAAAEVQRETARAAGDEAGAEEAEERMRTKAQQTSRLTVPMVEQATTLLKALGVPVLQAPGEGEAQASWMCQQGLVHAACSQDYDAILFGTPRLVRNLSVVGRRKLPGKQVWVDTQPEEIGLEESLAGSGLTREQLIDIALLVGTDFHPGIDGIGPKKALALIKKEPLESLIERLAANPHSAASAAERSIIEQHEALADREEVRKIFLQPAHAQIKPEDLEMKAPDAPTVRKLMVETHGFSPERVDTALERFGAARKRTGQKTLF